MCGTCIEWRASWPDRSVTHSDFVTHPAERASAGAATNSRIPELCDLRFVSVKSGTVGTAVSSAFQRYLDHLEASILAKSELIRVPTGTWWASNGSRAAAEARLAGACLN